jgi:hypothetical protein
MSITQVLRDSGPLERYGAGPIHFAGSDSGLYERHLLFDNVIAAKYADARDRFEAFARSGRDVLSQRWTLTQQTYASADAKRIYYLSMEFLIGRSLANNVTNLLLGPVVSEAPSERKTLIGSNCWSRNPMPPWETVGWDGLLPVSLNPWPPCNSRQWATGCATNTACSNRPSKTDGSANDRITGCAGRTRGRSRVSMKAWKSS